MSAKDSNQTKIETQLQEWETNLEKIRGKLETLKARAEELTGEARSNYLEQIKGLEERIHTTQKKMDEGKNQIRRIKTTAEDAIEDMKEGGQMAWDDLKTGIGNAWEDLKISMEVTAKKIQESRQGKK